MFLVGLICYYQNDLDRAIVYYRQAVEDKAILNTRAAVDSLVGRILAYQAKNEPGLVQATMQELEDYVTGLTDSVYTAIAHFFQIRLSVFQGRLLNPQLTGTGRSILPRKIWFGGLKFLK